jgi:aminoglycoside phosphotransferase
MTEDADAEPGHAEAGGPGTAVSVADNPGGVSIDRLVAELPPPIADLGTGARWSVVQVAPTGATVWRLDRTGGAAVYLKVAPEAAGAAGRLRREEERLGWLSDLAGAALALPAVVASATDPETGDHYLALTEVPGLHAGRAETRGDAESLIGALAAGLRALHELPATTGPAVTTVDDLLARAGARVEEDLVDPRRFEPLHARYTPGQLHQHLITLRPPGPEDPVVVHGDPRLDNTLVRDGRVSGYVGLSRSGVADRYLDLAIVARELAKYVSPHALGPFFAAYGIDAPDVRKVDFYLLLDELL